MRLRYLWLFILVCSAASARADLETIVRSVEVHGDKVLVSLNCTNRFAGSVRSVRANLFLFDDQGKVVQQNTRWIYHQAKDKPVLRNGDGFGFTFVLPRKPFSKLSIGVARVVLDTGQVFNVARRIEWSNNRPTEN